MGSLAKRQGGPWGLVTLSPIKLTMKIIVDNIKRKPGTWEEGRAVYSLSGRVSSAGTGSCPQLACCREPGSSVGLKAGTGGQREFCKAIGKGPSAVGFHVLIDFPI